MMKLSKKILAIALAVIMVLSVLPFSAFATEYEAGSQIDGPSLQTGDKIFLEGTIVRALFGGAVLKAGQFLEFSSYKACKGGNKANGTVTSSDIYLSDNIGISDYYFKYVEDYDSGKCYVPIDENGNVLEYILVLEKTGDFEPITFGTYVATVTSVAEVNGTQYATLEEAIAAANAGDTVKLLADIDFTVYPAFTRHTLDLTGVTLDLDGHTITGYNHSVVYVGDNFTIKNGNMVCVYDSVNNKKESYAAVIYPQEGNWQTDVVTDKSTGVVLENLVLTGGINCFGADVTVRGENTKVTGNYYYALWADVLATLTVEDGTFTSAASSTNGIIGACSDAGKEAYVYISGGDYTVPAGKNLVLQSTMASSQQLVEISGGTYNVVVPAKACAEGFVPVTEPDAQGKYTVAVDTAVAEVNGVKYDTLEEAIAAVQDGETIKLVDNVNVAATIVINDGKNFTIDTNGKTISSTVRVFEIRNGGVTLTGNGTLATTAVSAVAVYGSADSSAADYAVFTLGENATISAENGYGAMIGANSKAAYGAKLTINGMIDSKYGVYVNGNVQEPADKTNAAQVTINGTVGAGPTNTAVYAAGYAKWTVNDGATIEGGSGAIYIKSGDLVVNGGTITATGEKTAYVFNSNGANGTGDGIIIDSCGYPGNVPTVAINGGTISSTNGDAVASYTKQDDPRYSDATFERVDEVIPATSAAVFSSDVSALAEDGYKTVYDEAKGGYVVEEIQYGTIEQMTGATITGNGTAHEKISIENTTMSYAEPDYSVGRYYAGYYLSGVKFVAPEGTVISENARYTNGSIDSETGQLKVKNLYTAKDGANFMYSWPHVTEESLKEAIAAGVNKTWTYTFDWDGDGYFEQEAIIEIVCDTVTLVKDGEQVYPVVANNGSSLTLTDGVKFNAYIDADAYGVDANEAVVKLTYNHNADVSKTKAFSTDTIALTDATKYVKAGDPYDGTYKFAFAVAPAQYAEDITIELYATADAETPLFTTTTNVKTMCEKVIALAETESTYAAYANLCKALADYCQAAQVFFSYDAPAAPAYYNDAVTTLAAADMEVPTAFVGIEAAGFSFTIVSALEVNVFYNGDLDIQNVSIDSTKGADAVKAETTTKGGKNCINITGIASGNLDNVITVNTSAGVVELSATNIAKAIAGSADTNYANLARALYLYSVQASAFFGA